MKSLFFFLENIEENIVSLDGQEKHFVLYEEVKKISKNESEKFRYSFLCFCKYSVHIKGNDNSSRGELVYVNPKRKHCFKARSPFFYFISKHNVSVLMFVPKVIVKL